MLCYILNLTVDKRRENISIRIYQAYEFNKTLQRSFYWRLFWSTNSDTLVLMLKDKTNTVKTHI